jgi:REP element-mobilizing transposase RayT
MVRGVERRTIFRCEADFEDFLARLGLLVHELEFLVLAWCLLDNHAHFVLKTGKASLATLMARLTGRHAQRFNRTSTRVGHLFQDRYKAVLIEEEAHLACAVPYVLGNAARHGGGPPNGMSDYPWSGYGALVGRRPPRPFEAVEETVRALGMERNQLADRVAQVALEPAALGASLEPDQIDELERLISDCCARHGIERATLRSRRTHVREARIEICSRAATALDLTLAEISRHSGIPYETVRCFGAGLDRTSRIGV